LVEFFVGQSGHNIESYSIVSFSIGLFDEKVVGFENFESVLIFFSVEILAKFRFPDHIFFVDLSIAVYGLHISSIEIYGGRR
jgi:hypothetical protein